MIALRAIVVSQAPKGRLRAAGDPALNRAGNRQEHLLHHILSIGILQAPSPRHPTHHRLIDSQKLSPRSPFPGSLTRAIRLWLVSGNSGMVFTYQESSTGAEILTVKIRRGVFGKEIHRKPVLGLPAAQLGIRARSDHGRSSRRRPV